MPPVRLEPGASYRFGSRRGLRPVHVHVGRIDEPADLGHRVMQPVVSTIILATREGMPRIALAPFHLSALFLDPVEPIPPVDLQGSDFAENYRGWRTAWEAGEAAIWDIGPAEVYDQAIRAMLESRGLLARPPAPRLQ